MQKVGMQTVEFYIVTRCFSLLVGKHSVTADRCPAEYWGSRRDPVPAIEVFALEWEETKHK